MKRVSVILYSRGGSLDSGVKKWVYSDNGGVDPADARVPYYWRALNEQNVPKPSIVGDP